ALDKSGRKLSISEHDSLLKMNVSALKSSCPLPGYVSLFVGMPMILHSQNLSTDLGITNGSQGIVQQIFITRSSAGFNHASCVLVHFPDSKVHLSKLPQGWYPICPATWTFTTTMDGANGIQERLWITRAQVPLQPAFAITAHSVQGKTLPRVLVN
ncbi:uncharacterized protein F5891DRAFT_904765, partial [Suillus fuscotomentosus]